MSVTSRHKKSSYGSLFNSTIGGLFFQFSVFTGSVQNVSVFLKHKLKPDINYILSIIHKKALIFTYRIVIVIVI